MYKQNGCLNKVKRHQSPHPSHTFSVVSNDTEVNPRVKNKEIIFLDSFSEKCNNDGVGGIWSQVPAPCRNPKEVHTTLPRRHCDPSTPYLSSLESKKFCLNKHNSGFKWKLLELRIAKTPWERRVSVSWVRSQNPVGERDRKSPT